MKAAKIQKISMKSESPAKVIDFLSKKREKENMVNFDNIIEEYKANINVALSEYRQDINSAIEDFFYDLKKISN